MRRVLAFLTLVALLLSPVTAAAAQAACGHDSATAMAGMDMPAMSPSVAGYHGAKGDPCCDPGGKSHRISEKGCMQACAAACAVAVALPASFPIDAATYARASLDLPIMTLAHGRAPARLERPPKSIA